MRRRPAPLTKEVNPGDRIDTNTFVSQVQKYNAPSNNDFKIKIYLNTINKGKTDVKNILDNSIVKIKNVVTISTKS